MSCSNDEEDPNPSPSQSQSKQVSLDPNITYPILCAFGSSIQGQGLSPATNIAIQGVNSICSVLGVRYINVYQGGVPNASATVVNNIPIIVYNPDFMNKLSNYNPAAPFTVLGHEVGHHVNFDLTYYGQFQHPWTKELRADYVAGVAMRRLYVSLDQTVSLYYWLFDAQGSSSHPDSFKRIDAVTQGWLRGF